MLYGHEHLELQATLARHIDAETNPHVDEWAAAGAFPARQAFRQLGAPGLLGVAKPVEFGGMGLDYSYSMAMAEALGRIHCGGVRMAIGVRTAMCTPALARFGSDVAAIRTTARRDGGDYLIDGSKMWISNALQADWICLLANTSDGPAHKNQTLIMVPMDTPGVSVGAPIRKIGMHCSDTAPLHFDAVRVPRHYAVGEEGRGFTYQMLQFQVEGPRALTYRAGALYAAGRDATALASMAKREAGRLLRLVPDGCLQFWGGMGYSWENRVARLFRDGRLASIAGGADEVMLAIIAKSMGIHPGRQQ